MWWTQFGSCMDYAFIQYICTGYTIEWLRPPAYTFTAIFIHVQNPCKRHVSLCSSISKPYIHVFFNGFEHEGKLLWRCMLVAVRDHSLWLKWICNILIPNSSSSSSSIVMYIMTSDFIIHGLHDKSIKDLEPLVKAMYRKLEPLFYVLTFQILHSSQFKINCHIQSQ